KRYELTDHLGNVRAVVSDRRIRKGAESAPEVYSMTDYYPFGSEMNKSVDGKYSWGFQGMMKDDEWKGNGKSYDFGARMYDPQTGRWRSVDPLFSDYPWQSTYVGLDNKPVSIIDPSGQGGQSTHTDKDGNVIAVYDDGDLGVYKHEDATTRTDIDQKYTKADPSAG